MSKISVKGGGMYGCVVTEFLQECGHKVTLHETADRILSGASFDNFRRLHAGWHYPLSMETARECSMAHDEFVERYASYTYPMQTRYWIAEGSNVPSQQYLDFAWSLDPSGSRFEAIPNPWDLNNVETGIEVTEFMYDVLGLRDYFENKFKISNKPPDKSSFVIDCTYTNSPLVKKCEHKSATILRLDAKLPNIAQTVLYGPYCGVIPAIEGGFFFYHAKYQTADKMLEDGKRFFPELAKATVLDVRHMTHVRPPSAQDHRPYLIEQTNENTICVLGGKIAQSIDCAQRVAGKVKRLGIMPDKG